MPTTREKGALGEAIAEKYLSEFGYDIVAKNLSCPYGEIDLVARKGAKLFFVEIRLRIGGGYGSALESLAAGKLNRIRKAAQFFLLRNIEWQRLIPYFSVIAIDGEHGAPPRIEFLPDAFE